MEHGQLILGCESRRLASLGHLVSSLLRVHFKRFNAFSKAANLLINSRKISFECLFKDFEGLLLGQLSLHDPSWETVDSQFEKSIKKAFSSTCLISHILLLQVLLDCLLAKVIDHQNVLLDKERIEDPSQDRLVVGQELLSIFLLFAARFE